MGRGSRRRARELEESRRGQLFGQVQEEIGAIPPDLTPEQRAGITQARLGGIDIGYGNIMDEAKRRFARTGSRAAAPELALEIGRERTREKSRAGAELEQYFAEVPVQRRLARAGAYTPIFQGTGQLLSSLYSRGPSTLDRILGAGTQIGSAAIMRPR